jgi:hypothetical protein
MTEGFYRGACARLEMQVVLASSNATKATRILTKIKRVALFLWIRKSLSFLSDILPQASFFVVLRRKKGHPGISLDPVDVIVNRSHAAHIFGDDPDGVAFSFIGQYAM